MIKKQVVLRNIKVSGKKGQGFTEYALVISFIALVVIIGLQVLGLKLADFFNSFTNMF